MSATSPTTSDHYSEVPTEPIPPSEQRLVYEYMSRRQHFLSDFERYNPVQNMQMLAHHVFELTESVGHIKNDFTSSRRLLGIVVDSQREINTTVRALGGDLEKFVGGLGTVDGKVEGLKSEVEALRSDMNGLKGEAEALRSDMNGLRTEMHTIRQETQQGIQELKQMLTLIMTVRT